MSTKSLLADVSSSTQNLEELPGVGPATAEKLRDSGFDSYQSLAVASPAELSNSADIGESKAPDVIQAAREEADVGGFESGAAILKKRNEIGSIRFRIDELDDLLGGGIETQSITEFYGEYSSGKSQVTHQLAVNVQLPQEVGGVDGRAIFVDTEDTFRPERIDEMVRGLDDESLQATLDHREIDGHPDDEAALEELVESVLGRIHVAKAFNSDHQILLAEKAQEIAKEYAEDDHPVRLVCVDSLTAHFRAEYVGRGQLSNRQQKLNQHLHDLEKVGSLHNAAVVVTNQVQSNPDAFFGDPTKPIGGNILGHKSTFRLYLRNSKQNKRVVKLVDAPNLPDGEAVVRITDAGVVEE